MKIYTQAPLPFMGQKRRFLREFKAALEQYPSDGVYVDLFGGSGLLAHTVKRLYPDAQVIYNDFDNYAARIDNIPRTNALLADIRELVEGLPLNKPIRLPHRDLIIDRVSSEPGFVDYITLSSSLLFSMNYVTSFEALKKERLYNTIRKGDYNGDGYLDGLYLVREDYRRLFARYQAYDKVVFLIDPPYLSTDCGVYNNYCRLTDYLDVLDTLKTGAYFYFTSNKSSIIELCEWVANKTGGVNPFAGAVVKQVNTTLNYSSSYTDIMLYRDFKSTVG